VESRRSVANARRAHFVESLRMKEAQRRLLLSQSSIKRVALSLGYRSVHFFPRAFERKFGVTPGAYRERFGAAS
jgi:AraC-like DNA-binding protein